MTIAHRRSLTLIEIQSLSSVSTILQEAGIWSRGYIWEGHSSGNQLLFVGQPMQDVSRRSVPKGKPRETP